MTKVKSEHILSILNYFQIFEIQNKCNRIECNSKSIRAITYTANGFSFLYPLSKKISHTYLKTKSIIYQFAFNYIAQLLLTGNIIHHFIDFRNTDLYLLCLAKKP